MRKDSLDLIAAIVDRAEQLDLLMFDRVSLMMDLEFADQEFNLRLEEFLQADNFNFSHDIVGIQNHLDRREKRMTGMFLPRFAGKIENR